MTGRNEELNVEAFPGHATSLTPYGTYRQYLQLKYGCDLIERTVELTDTERTHPSTDSELRLKFVVPIGVRIGGWDGLEQVTSVCIPVVFMAMEPFRKIFSGNWNDHLREI